MKYNIKKLQSGGGFATFTPIVRSLPGEQMQSSMGVSGTSEKSDEDEGSSIISKKMMDDLYSGGLVNDVHKFVNELVNMEKTSDLPYLNKGNRSMALLARAKFNEIKENKEYWTKAIDRAKENGALGEIAVSGNRIFVETKDKKVQSMSLEEYKTKRDKVKPMTVQELMYARQYYASMTGQNNVFTVADNAVGLNKITDHIKTIVAAIGQDESSSEQVISKVDAQKQLASFTGKQPTKQEMQSLSILSQVLSNPSNYSKVKIESSTEKNNLNLALNYIWKTLGTPAQEKLTATAVVNGENNPLNFIMQILEFGTNQKSSTSVEPITDEAATGKKKTNTEGDKPITPFEIQHNGKFSGSIIGWNDPKTGLTMNLSGNQVNLWDNATTNTLLKMGPLENLLNSHTGALLDQSKVYFGNREISSSDRQNIIIDPSAGSARVFFPVKNGTNEPDYELMKTIKELVKSAPGNISPEELTKYFAKNGFEYIQFDNNYQIKPNTNFKPFLLLYGYADEKSGTVKDNSEIKELEGAESSEAAGTLSRIWDKEKIKSPTGIFNWSNTYYKGNILIPYLQDSPIIASSIAGNATNPRISLDEAKQHFNLDNARTLNASSSIFYNQ